MRSHTMAVTPRHGSRSQPPPPSGLGFGQMVQLGVLGLASDIRDRSRDPALRKRPSARALDPRLHRPIFIIGAPRSGTTFLGSCLGRMPEVSDIVRSAWCWRRFTEASLAGLATLPAGRSVEVRYESVVSDPMHAADVLGGFLETTPAGLDALRAGLARAKPDSVGRWRKTLDPGQISDVEQEIGPLLARPGYA